MEHLENMVEEKGIEPSTFALRMLPRVSVGAKSITYGCEDRPKTVCFGHEVARSGHSKRRDNLNALQHNISSQGGRS